MAVALSGVSGGRRGVPVEGGEKELGVYGGSLLLRHEAHIMNAGVSGFSKQHRGRGVCLGFGMLRVYL